MPCCTVCSQYCRVRLQMVHARRRASNFLVIMSLLSFVVVVVVDVAVASGGARIAY